MFIPSKENEAKNNHLSLGRCPHQTSLLMSTFLPRSVSSPNVCGFLDIVKIDYWREIENKFSVEEK
jgi:hypothetical protein